MTSILISADLVPGVVAQCASSSGKVPATVQLIGNNIEITLLDSRTDEPPNLQQVDDRRVAIGGAQSQEAENTNSETADAPRPPRPDDLPLAEPTNPIPHPHGPDAHDPIGTHDDLETAPPAPQILLIVDDNPIAPQPANLPAAADLDSEGLQTTAPVLLAEVVGAEAPALVTPIGQLPAPEPAQDPTPMPNQEQFTLDGGPPPLAQSTTHNARVWFTDASHSGCAHAYVQGRGRQVLTVQGKHLERFCLAIKLLQLDLPISMSQYEGRSRYESCTVDADVAFNAIVEMCGRVMTCASPEIAGIDLDLGLDVVEAPGVAEVALRSAAAVS